MAKNNNKKKKKTSKEKKKRTFWLVLLLLFFIVLCTSATYAWFSSNKRATIDAMDINVATVSGIQVSVDGINWKNEVSKDEIVNAFKTYPSATNQLPETLAGCSTDGSVSNGKLNMYYGVTRERDETFYLTTYLQEEINCVGDEECQGKHYIAFDLFFLVTVPTTLVITPASNVINRGDYDDGGQNSARIGFVILGTVADTATGATAQNLRNATGSYIWEPNYDMHTDYGVRNALATYGISTSQTGGARIPYRGVNQEITGIGVPINQTHNSPYFSPVTPQVATVKGFATDQVLTSIPRGITKMRIYLWLEGQDVDLENNAAMGKLQFNLELAVADR